MTGGPTIQELPFDPDDDCYRKFPPDQKAEYAAAWSKIYMNLVYELNWAVENAANLLRAEDVCDGVITMLAAGELSMSEIAEQLDSDHHHEDFSSI